MKYRYHLLYATLFISIVLLMAFIPQQNQSNEENNKARIKFSHKFHLESAECIDCHSKVPESEIISNVLLPKHSDCQSCHEVEDKEECNTCHYENKYEKLQHTKVKINFNHKVHLQNEEEELNCVDCHKGLDEVEYSFQSASLFPKMQTCYTCHSGEKVASNDCTTCHQETANLKPQNHKSVNFIFSHKFAASNFDSNCIMCHQRRSCEDCHEATNTITEENTGDDFYQPYAPTTSNADGKNQQIAKVHEFNYRFIHGIDAQGKSAECQTCHQIENFCTNCHQSEKQDFALEGIAPASHLKPNFSTIGVGTGGGLHAQMARRDIESCQSCHDVQGADPTCITCHLDSDGIKGTNPKTHPSGFMNSIRGEWHDTQGAVCFNCHTSFSPSSLSGTGFCGYCHGKINN